MRKFRIVSSIFLVVALICIMVVSGCSNTVVENESIDNPKNIDAPQTKKVVGGDKTDTQEQTADTENSSDNKESINPDISEIESIEDVLIHSESDNIPNIVLKHLTLKEVIWDTHPNEDSYKHRSYPGNHGYLNNQFLNEKSLNFRHFSKDEKVVDTPDKFKLIWGKTLFSDYECSSPSYYPVSNTDDSFTLRKSEMPMHYSQVFTNIFEINKNGEIGKSIGVKETLARNNPEISFITDNEAVYIFENSGYIKQDEEKKSPKITKISHKIMEELWVTDLELNGYANVHFIKIINDRLYILYENYCEPELRGCEEYFTQESLICMDIKSGDIVWNKFLPIPEYSFDLFVDLFFDKGTLIIEYTNYEIPSEWEDYSVHDWKNVTIINNEYLIVESDYPYDLMCFDKDLKKTWDFNGCSQYQATHTGILAISSDKITMLNQKTGETLWERAFEDNDDNDDIYYCVNGLFCYGNKIFVSTPRYIFAYDTNTGEELHKFQFPVEIDSYFNGNNFFVMNNILFFINRNYNGHPNMFAFEFDSDASDCVIPNNVLFQEYWQQLIDPTSYPQSSFYIINYSNEPLNIKIVYNETELEILENELIMEANETKIVDISAIKKIREEYDFRNQLDPIFVYVNNKEHIIDVVFTGYYECD